VVYPFHPSNVGWSPNHGRGECLVRVDLFPAGVGAFERYIEVEEDEMLNETLEAGVVVLYLVIV